MNNSTANLLSVSRLNRGVQPNYGAVLYALCPASCATNDNGTLQSATFKAGGPGYPQFLVINQSFNYDIFALAAEYSTGSNAMTCTTCYPAWDHLGSTRMLMDQNANVIARHDYLPFGEEILANTVGRDSHWGPLNDTVAQKFTGQTRDQETAIDFFNARYFGPALGRFTSPDPANAGADIMNPQSWNAYAYVLGNPLGLVDPSGMSIVPCEDPKSIACVGNDPEPPPAEPPPSAPGYPGCVAFGTEGCIKPPCITLSAGCILPVNAGGPPNTGSSGSLTQSQQPANYGNPIAVVPFLTQRSCSDIANDINNLRDELARRFQEYGENAQPIPLFGPFSRAGHVQQITNKQTNLRNLLNEFHTNGCGGMTNIPGDAWQFATRQAPAITPSRPWVKYAAIGAGVIIVGGTAILAPELLPLEFALVP